jgi:hypothetical protein
MDKSEIISALFLMTDRQTGEALLKKCSKLDLVEISKVLDIPHNLSIKKLTSGIIENTIGFRLRSNAIQGK